MATISLLKLGRLLGSNTVLGMAKIFGVTPPPPPISVRALVESFGLPLQPTDLKLFWDFDVAGHIIFHPPDATGVPLDKTIQFDFRDSAGTPARKATSFELDIKVAATGQEFGGSPFSFVRGFGTTGFQPNTAYSWNVLPLNDFGRGPRSPTVTFRTAEAPPPPPPPPPPPNLVGISKLSLFNCQIERHTVFVWVRDVTGNGPWGQVQTIPTQFNESDPPQCPFDDNGILADSVAILTRSGEGGGFACTSGNIYQVSIVDPERPTCDGRNDPTIGNCVVEDQPSFFRFDRSGDEITVMLENGRLSPVPT